MAGVMSNSTPCFKATLPTAASTGPSMGGWLFQVIVRSPHAQLLMAWICPPERLLEPVAEDTCRCSLAEVTGCVPVPVTLMRRKVRFTGLASATRTVLAPALLVGLPEFTKASAVTAAAGTAGGQGGGGPPTQAPPAQVSAVVQALPSLHGKVFGAFTQPVAGSHESVVHTLASLQLIGGPPARAPPTQAAAPSQVLPLMHGLLAQAWPAGSNWQVGEQQSPAARLPSSHCSPRSTTPLPQTCAILPMIVLNWSVCCPPAGKPGPSIRTKFVPQVLPMTVWFAAGLPTRPGSGAGASAVRNGPTRPAVIGGVKAAAGPAAPTGMRGLSWVKFTVPRLSACSTSTP